MAVSSIHTGWRFDRGNSRLDVYYRGTRLGHFDASGMTSVLAIDATTTVTAGTGLTVTTGNDVVSAGDLRVTAGNIRLGVVEDFSMTQPTSAMVFKVGTNPVGAITTSGGIFVTTGGASISKIVAAGTVTTVQA